jgi:hypothetical protein
MSTQFKNQWILARSGQGRGTACAPAKAQEGAEPGALVPCEALPARPHQRSRPPRQHGGLYKRPKWIDRDT